MWMYWEDPPGRQRAAYLDLCLETVRRNLGPLSLEILDQDTAPDRLPGIDLDRWRRLPAPNYRSDYARTRLVHRFGGIWLDFDCIVMAPLSRLLEPLAQNEVVGWGREAGGRFYSGLFAARPGARLIEAWAAAQDQALDALSDWSHLPWALLAQDSVRPVAAEFGFHNLPLGTIAPVMWYEWRRFLSQVASPAPVLAGHPVTVMLWNELMAPALAGTPRERLLSDRTLLSRLIRIALGHSTLPQELDTRTRLHLAADLRFSAAGRSAERRLRRLFRLAQ